MPGGPQVLQEIDDMSVRWDRVSATRRFQGHASPGASEGAAVWRIKRMTFGTTSFNNRQLIAVEFADGDANYNNIWSNRTSLDYS